MDTQPQGASTNKPNNNLPNFIGIGAARSGTTWIAEQLSQHPGVWIPSRKELHYWTRDRKYTSPSFLGEPSLISRYFGEDYSLDLCKRFCRAIGKSVLDLDLKSLTWNLNYFLGKPDNAWYSKLFTGHQFQLTGEITPAYSLLDEIDISALTHDFPDIKAILILRNPIERAWSTILYHDKRNMISLEDMTQSEIEQYLSKSQITQRSDYLSIIKRWSKHLKKEHLLVVYYDEISSEPAQLYNKLLNFLDLDPPENFTADFKKRINASKTVDMPAWLTEHLKSQYLPGMKKMADDLGEYPAAWYAKYR